MDYIHTYIHTYGSVIIQGSLYVCIYVNNPPQVLPKTIIVYMHITSKHLSVWCSEKLCLFVYIHTYIVPSMQYLFIMYIGDHFYKENFSLPLEEQMISAMPDIKSVPINDDQEFIIFACDGIWYVHMYSEEGWIMLLFEMGTN